MIEGSTYVLTAPAARAALAVSVFADRGKNGLPALASVHVVINDGWIRAEATDRYAALAFGAEITPKDDAKPVNVLLDGANALRVAKRIKAKSEALVTITFGDEFATISHETSIERVDYVEGGYPTLTKVFHKKESERETVTRVNPVLIGRVGDWFRIVGGDPKRGATFEQFHGRVTRATGWAARGEFAAVVMGLSAACASHQAADELVSRLFS